MPAPLPPTGSPAASIADVIGRMQSIDAALPASDGLACFNRMYLEVTQHVEAMVGQQAFQDPAWTARLDVVFANLYFDAVNALVTTPASLPAAWKPLLAARDRAGIEPIQFALAGMNAHINHDLPLAVVQTCTQLATAPADGSHHADYQQVDVLLDAAEQSIRQSFESRPELAVDHHLQAVATLVCNWSMNSARDVAWDMALALWPLRDISVAENLLLGSLARTVGMASRLLLIAA